MSTSTNHSPRRDGPFAVRSASTPASWVEPLPAPTVRSAFGPAPVSTSHAPPDDAEPPAPAAEPPPEPTEDTERRDDAAEALLAAMDDARTRGEAEGRQSYDEAVARLDHVIADLERARQTLFSGVDDALAELAVAIARALLQRELADDKEYVSRLVTEALRLVASDQPVTIAARRADAELLEARLKKIANGGDDARTVRVRIDETITAGCVVETPDARVDATVDGRLRNVADALIAGGAS